MSDQRPPRPFASTYRAPMHASPDSRRDTPSGGTELDALTAKEQALAAIEAASFATREAQEAKAANARAELMAGAAKASADALSRTFAEFRGMRVAVDEGLRSDAQEAKVIARQALKQGHQNRADINELSVAVYEALSEMRRSESERTALAARGVAAAQRAREAQDDADDVPTGQREYLAKRASRADEIEAMAVNALFEKKRIAWRTVGKIAVSLATGGGVLAVIVVALIQRGC